LPATASTVRGQHHRRRHRPQSLRRIRLPSHRFQIDAPSGLQFFLDYFLEGWLRPEPGELFDPNFHQGHAEYLYRIWWDGGGVPELLFERSWLQHMEGEFGIDGPWSFRVSGSGNLWWERAATLDVLAGVLLLRRLRGPYSEL
jgi:hypothetical protein